ncbi:hypothetical protein LA080_001967 [Diaporthe eres]|nr:hypothetical protein LA080_001967 [Diaporthe eres]
MGEIYSNAYCTIIAAAGENARTGLLGVSRARRKQREVNVKDVTLMELPYSKDHGSALLSSSKWATRGWTYQEGYLSTRRLIFADYRLLYLCNRQFSPEPFKGQDSTTGVAVWTKEHWARRHSFARFVPHTAFSGHRASAANLRGQIQEYTRRDLSHSEDSLNAFLGVLDYNSQDRETNGPPLGIATVRGSGLSAEAKRYSIRTLLVARSSKHQEAQVSKLDLGRLGRPCEVPHKKQGPHVPRRTTPAATEPPGRHQHFRHSHGHRRPDTIRIRRRTSEKAKTRDLLPSQLGPRRLLVSCHVLPLRMQRFHLHEDRINDEYFIKTQHPSSAVINNEWSRRPSHPAAGGHLAVVQVCGAIYMCKRPWLDQKVSQWNDCFALHFGTTQNTSPGLFTRDRNLLVVRRICGEVYKRVGLIHWHFLDFDQPIFFIDAEAEFMGEVVLPAEDELFCSVAEKKTICLA